MVLALTVLIAGCVRRSAVGDQAADMSVQISFTPSPPVVGEGTISLKVEDAHGDAIDGLDIQVKGDMAHAGMTPVFGVSVDDGEGRYSIPFEWTMSGDWILQIAADLPDGRVLNRSFEAYVAPD